MTGLYLFARIAGTEIAVRTDEVEAVVKLGELSAVPGAPGYVAGLSALRSRVLTVIDAAALITGDYHGAVSDRSTERYAVMCDISGHSYGILVDGVDDVRTIETPPVPVHGRVDAIWKPHVRAVIEENGKPHFLISVAGLLEHCSAVQAG